MYLAQFTILESIGDWEHLFARNGNGHGDVERPWRPLRRCWPLRVFGGQRREEWTRITLVDPSGLSWQIASAQQVTRLVQIFVSRFVVPDCVIVAEFARHTWWIFAVERKRTGDAARRWDRLPVYEPIKLIVESSLRLGKRERATTSCPLSREY